MNLMIFEQSCRTLHFPKIFPLIFVNYFSKIFQVLVFTIKASFLCSYLWRFGPIRLQYLLLFSFAHNFIEDTILTDIKADWTHIS